MERQWNARALANLFGVIFLIVGIVGFFSNPLVSDHGVFLVNGAHNFVHIVTGLVLIAGAYGGAPVTTLRWVGVIYAIVAILGILMPNREIAGIEMNWADNWLHVVAAFLILVAGFTASPVEDRIGQARM